MEKVMNTDLIPMAGLLGLLASECPVQQGPQWVKCYQFMCVNMCRGIIFLYAEEVSLGLV